MVRYVLTFFLALASPVFAQAERCVGPITMTAAGTKAFSFGSQNQGYNDTFTAVIKSTAGSGLSAQITASLDGVCNGGANNYAYCQAASECPSGVCVAGAGPVIPLNRAGTALAAVTTSTTTVQQFDGPWNQVIFTIATCTGCSVTFNICGKDS